MADSSTKSNTSNRQVNLTRFQTVANSWALKAEYQEKETWPEIHFSPDLTRHIFMLGERFVRHPLEFARGLRSAFSTNLLLMTQKDTGFKTITLADFRATMEVPETYRYADIKRYAITPAVE